MTKYENIVKKGQQMLVPKKKDDRGPLDLARQIGELQCENEGLKQKVHDAELETSIIKAVGMNSPEMKAAKEKITELEETLKSRDYFKQHDYRFLIDENRKLEEERNMLTLDNKRLAEQIDDQVNALRKGGLL